MFTLFSKLAKLYRALREDDIVLGLAEKHVCHNLYTKSALEAELKGDYLSAHNVSFARGCTYFLLYTWIYIKALAHLDSGSDWEGPAPTNNEIDLWEEGKLECLAKLGKWEDLQKNTLVEFPDTNELFLEKNMYPYLDYFLVSHIKLRESWQNLYKFVDSVEGDNKKVLEDKYTPGIFICLSMSLHIRLLIYLFRTGIHLR